MSHEDYLDQDELDAFREQFKQSPQRENNVVTKGAQPQGTQPQLETMDYCTVKLPKPLLWVLLYLLIGIVIGAFGHSVLTMPKERPATETLEDFAARESQSLTADERRKLIVATETVLSKHFDTPSAVREEFHYQRLKAGADSPAVQSFLEKWAAKVEKMDIEESTGAMREIYTQLIQGLKSSGGLVEGFLTVLPSNVTPDTTSGDVPVPPDSFNRTRILRRR